jgi:hypothetical protein
VIAAMLLIAQLGQGLHSIPSEYRGRFIVSWRAEGRGSQKCAAGLPYLHLRSRRLGWGAREVAVTHVEKIDDRDIVVTTDGDLFSEAPAKGAYRYHFFLDPADDHPIVVYDVEEYEAFQTEHPKAMDGPITLYLRCEQ